MKRKSRLPHVVLSVCLIVFGASVLYYCVPMLLGEGLFSVIAILLYIPTLLMVAVLPIYSGFALLYEDFIKRKKDDPADPE